MTRQEPSAAALDPVSTAVEVFWQAYLETLPEEDRGRRYFEAFQFGAGRAMADQLAHLVLDGIKTATSDLVWHIQAQGKKQWRVGDEHVVLDGSWRPVCVIRTTELDVRRFADIDERFAFDYGEGDRSLEWWQRHLYAWYSSQCREIGREPSPDMPLLCERFELVYPRPRGAS